MSTRKIDRPLTDMEREAVLSRKREGDVRLAHRSVIRLNSTFLELADHKYSTRGLLSMQVIYAVALLGSFAIFMAHLLYSKPAEAVSWQLISSVIFSFSLVLAIVVVCSIICRRFGEWFGCTHYPIRFNRANRTVYIFRDDGSILEAGWDDIVFSVRNEESYGWGRGVFGFIRGDGDRFVETFAVGTQTRFFDDLNRAHWEFVRRYMEEGPKAVLDTVDLMPYVPVAGKRETLRQGWLTITWLQRGTLFGWVFLPYFLFWLLGRQLYHRLSREPVWPVHVEEACRIDPNDPYERDSRHNPEEWR